MKILAFTDIHGSPSALKRLKQKINSQKPDLLVCAGDISIFEHGIVGILRRLNKLNKKIIIIHGNHEDDSTFRKLSKIFKNILFVHKHHFIQNNVLFLGYGGGGFAMTDREFEKNANSRFKKGIAGSVYIFERYGETNFSGCAVFRKPPTSSDKHHKIFRKSIGVDDCSACPAFQCFGESFD